MSDANEIMWKARAVLGRDLEADELNMLGRLLKAHEGDEEKSGDWYVNELIQLIEAEREDVPDDKVPVKAFWVEPGSVTEIE